MSTVFMEKYSSSDHFQDSVVTMNASFLRDTKGVTIFDSCILLVAKVIYLTLRILLRVSLGRKRRDRFYLKRKIGFNSFFYNLMRILGLSNHRLLKIIVPKYNYKFLCRINNEDYTFMTGHEDKILRRFSCKKEDIVLDVGAHIGHYTIISSERVGPKGRVVAIEADPSNFEMLNHNIRLNGLTNIISLNYAVYSKEEKVKLYLPSKDSGFTIYNTIMTDRASTEKDKFIQVNANTLDNLLQQNRIREEDVNWIKIDVEGAEYEVLKGATNILSKSKDIALLIEIHNLAGGINFHTQIVEFLVSYGFKIEFEKTYDSGERHIIARKSKDNTN
jgi:FkbM family methyltransferase